VKMIWVRGYDGSGFYAGIKDDKVFIKSNSVSSPFDYTYQLGCTIEKLSGKIPGDKVEVVFDLTPFLKKKTVFSLIYDKNSKIPDLNSYKGLSDIL